MSRDFPDNSGRLFGREPDLAYLAGRSRKPGVTAVLGRPQMGKTWLLQELGRRLSAKPQRRNVLSLQQGPSYPVGYFESRGEGNFLLQSVIDLYDRWFADSTYKQQAHAVYQKQKEDFIGRTGEAFGAIVEKAISIGPGAALAALIRKTFEGLAAANRDLNNPAGPLLPRLQIEQARELLELVHKVTQQPLVLIFDRWEKSPALQTEANILDSFLRHLSNWPPCHIFVGAWPDAPVNESLDQFFRFYPGKAEIYNLPRVHLDDSGSQSLVFNYLCASVPGAVTQKQTDLLELAKGYPGTISLWTSDYYADKLTSFDQFRQVAEEAEKNQFLEFKVLLKDLPKPLVDLSIRLALLPLTGNLEIWNALKPIILQDLSSTDLDDLRGRKVLESLAPPSFGHATRAAAALSWLENEQNNYYRIRGACEDLIYRIFRSGKRPLRFRGSLRGELAGTGCECK